jgi:hypothetical protein
LTAALIASIPSSAAPADLSLDDVVAHYREARGGVARWRQVASLSITGTYAAFSQRSPFTLIRRRGDLYRLDFTLLKQPAIRARDSIGPWWLHSLLQPKEARLTEGPYKAQLERESLFGPLLMDHEQRSITLELLGPGDLEGRPTVNLELTLPGGAKETWYLDAQTFLEVAIDSEVIDHTQGPKHLRQRTFFDDFREVKGLVLPFQVDHEFGARLEAMTVEEVVVNPELPDERFGPSPP